MAKIIVIATQKGGVCKTTTTGALAAGYKRNGKRVLAVDMDPQCNLSFSMAADCENSATIYHVLRGEVRTQFAIQHTHVTDIIASNTLLSGIELQFTGRGREFLLRDALLPIQDQYDYILIDSPPGLGIHTANALTCAHYVLVPMLPDIFSLQGIAQLYETVEHVRMATNPKIAFAGILLAKFNPHTRLAREVHGTAEMICKNLHIRLFQTTIHNCIALSEAQSLQRDMVKYAPYSTGVQDYLSLIDEMAKEGI